MGNIIERKKALEQIRQEQECFNQLKKQDDAWFALRLRMGYIAVGILIAIFMIALYFLLNSEKYPSYIGYSADTALFVDILGFIILVWKIVLSPNPASKLEPITKQ